MRNNFTPFFQSWSRALIFLILATFIGSIVMSMAFSDAIFSLVLLPVLYLFIVNIYLRWDSHSPQNYIAMLFVWSLIVRLLSVYIFSEVLIHYGGMPFLSEKDDFIYNQTSTEIAERWSSSGIAFYNDIQFSSGFYSGFPNFSASLKYIFGDSLFVPRIGNAVLSAISCVTAYKICKSYTSESKARVVGVIFMFSPLLLVYASLQLKDTMLLFLILTAMHASIKIIKGKITALVLFQFVISLFVMAFVRAASIVPLVGAYFLTILLLKTNNKLLVLIFSVGLFYFTYYLWGTISISSGVDIENYFDSRYHAMMFSSIENTNAGIANTSLGKLVGAPIYMIAGLFLPPPTIVELSNSETINYSLFGVVFHYSLLPFLCIAFFRSIKRRKEFIVPFYLAIVFILFKVGQANSVMSILSVRQSLTTIFIMYLMLPMCLDNIGKKNSRIMILLICIAVMIGYAAVRLYSRGML